MFSAGCVPLLILFHRRGPHKSKVSPTRETGSDFLKKVDEVFDIAIAVVNDAVSKTRPFFKREITAH